MKTLLRQALRAPGARLAAAALASGLAVAMLGCSTGTPAAPDGTEIPVTCEFLTRDVATGNFEALIKAVVIDQESDVPQVGVGVYFRVKSGPGEIRTPVPVVTDDDGRAQAVLVGRGATDGNGVTVEVSSGPVTSEIELDVMGCFSSTALPPVLVFSVAPQNTVQTGSEVTVTLTSSTDSDCPGGKPTSWSIEWGDGETSNDTFANEDKPTHTYANSFVPTAGGTRNATIDIEVTDCQGLTDSDTYSMTVRR